MTLKMDWIKRFESEWEEICNRLSYKGGMVYGWKRHFRLDEFFEQISKRDWSETNYGKHKGLFCIDEVSHDKIEPMESHQVYYFENEITKEDAKEFLRLVSINELIEIAEEDQDTTVYGIARDWYMRR